MARTNNRIFNVFLYIVFIASLFLCGCWPGADLIGEYEKDISHKQKYWGGYAKGQRYILLHDIFLQKEDLGFKYRIYAGVPPRDVLPQLEMDKSLKSVILLWTFLKGIWYGQATQTI